jgi:hypothetical protein
MKTVFDFLPFRHICVLKTLDLFKVPAFRDFKQPH